MFLEIAREEKHIAKMKPAAIISYQTVDAKIKHLNSSPALAFSVFCNTVTMARV